MSVVEPVYELSHVGFNDPMTSSRLTFNVGAKWLHTRHLHLRQSGCVGGVDAWTMHGRTDVLMYGCMASLVNAQSGLYTNNFDYFWDCLPPFGASYQEGSMHV